MMLGTLAQRGGVVQGQPEWLPVGATAVLDFVNGNYYAAGAPRNVGDLLGGGFDASEISAAGMYLAYVSANRPKAIGPLFADLAAGLAAGCTIVIEVNHVNPPYGYYLYFLDAASESAANDYVGVRIQNVSGAAMVADSPEIWLEGSEGLLDTTGIHRTAATLARNVDGGSYEYAVSCDGETAATYTVSYAPFAPVHSILIGHDGDDLRILDKGYVRKIEIYPAQLPADLPALSA